MTKATPLNLDTLAKMMDGENPITVFVAYKDHGFVTDNKITRITIKHGSHSALWADDHWSLRDAGVLKNDYNNHKTFARKCDAEEYAGVKAQRCCCRCCCKCDD